MQWYCLLILDCPIDCNVYSDCPSDIFTCVMNQEHGLCLHVLKHRNNMSWALECIKNLLPAFWMYLECTYCKLSKIIVNIYTTGVNKFNNQLKQYSTYGSMKFNLYWMCSAQELQWSWHQLTHSSVVHSDMSLVVLSCYGVNVLSS